MKFLDTNALMLGYIPDEKFLISSITLKELENIKTSFHKSEEQKYQARKALARLDSAEHEVITFQEKMLGCIKKADFEINDDAKIIACAKWYEKPSILSKRREVEFISGDRSCRNIAKNFLENVISLEEDKEEKYLGYKEVQMSDEEMCEFYSNLTSNSYDLLVNQYLIIRDKSGAAVDAYCWTGAEYRKLKTKSFYSEYFGEVKPIKGDIYQKLACDSLANNQFTILRGVAGGGKGFLGLGYLFSLLEKGKIDKIIIFANPVAVRDSAKIGLYPGSKDEKLLGSQIGNYLSSKLGDITEVERLISEGKLLLIPVSDSRGFDTTGFNCGIYGTEMQNTTVDIMKLLLERVGEDSVCVFEGDDDAQVDMSAYSGSNNGLNRACEVYKNEPYFGTVSLQICHRSKIAKKALEM